MSVATALVAGNEPSALLAEQAVRTAMKRAGLETAGGVLLMLSQEFARHAAPALRAAARSARSTQVCGCVAAGLCTEEGWTLDRPAAAAMVLASPFHLAADDHPSGTTLRFASAPLAAEDNRAARCGLQFHVDNAAGTVWQSGRVAETGNAEIRIGGATGRTLVSPGLSRLSGNTLSGPMRGFDLLQLDGRPALLRLRELLPADWRAREHLPLHLINAIVDGRGIAIIAANADGSLTLAESLPGGTRLGWALRDPAAAAAEIEDLLAPLAAPPDFMLFFSCIGRGPYFYGGDDRDLAALTRRFPGVPLLGAYGTGQFAGAPLLHNTVVAALFNEESDVQPQP